MSDSSIKYAQALTNIQHARLTPVVDRCEEVGNLESVIHYKGGGRRVVSGQFAQEINSRLREEADDGHHWRRPSDDVPGGEFD